MLDTGAFDENNNLFHLIHNEIRDIISDRSGYAPNLVDLQMEELYKLIKYVFSNVKLKRQFFIQSLLLGKEWDWRHLLTVFSLNLPNRILVDTNLWSNLLWRDLPTELKSYMMNFALVFKRKGIPKGVLSSRILDIKLKEYLRNPSSFDPDSFNVNTNRFLRFEIEREYNIYSDSQYTELNVQVDTLRKIIESQNKKIEEQSFQITALMDIIEKINK